MFNKNKKGFTLIELLIVIAIIAILAAIIFVAVDPAKRGKQARDAQRYSEINSVLNAVLNYGVDNNVSNFSNAAPDGLSITTTAQDLSAIPDLTNYLVDKYISEIPSDPKTGQYQIKKTANDRIQVSAPNAELTTPMSVSR